MKKIRREQKVNVPKIAKDCSFLNGTKILLYGAGYWGNIYYRWISEHSEGKIVGWIDNFWYTYDHTGYPITPLDSMLYIAYDYVLIAIKNKKIQKEVAEDLISWGVSLKRIRFITVDD